MPRVHHHRQAKLFFWLAFALVIAGSWLDYDRALIAGGVFYLFYLLHAIIASLNA